VTVGQLAPSTLLVDLTLQNTNNAKAAIYTLSQTTKFQFLQVLASVGGTYTIIEGVFAMIFGKSMMGILFGEWPVSSTVVPMLITGSSL
jgi:hypothetical protein